MKLAQERIRDLLEQWSLSEPAYFAALTSHRMVVNPNIKTIRVINGLIEYNSGFIDGLGKNLLKEYLAFEATRILLCHPYQRRRPCLPIAWLASSVSIKEHTDTVLPIPTAEELLKTDQWNRSIFEFYYEKLMSSLPKLGGLGEEEDPLIAFLSGLAEAAGADGAFHDYILNDGINAEGWEDDLLMMESIRQLIDDIQQTQNWGSIPGSLQEKILANLEPKLDYRNVLRRFRSSVLSSERNLTRMKPNRRFGFDYMGSRRDFVTKLLVAVDISGSVTSEDLAVGFSIINRFFRYGVETIDVIQFDTEIKGQSLELKKARANIDIVGRGGTCFQPVIDYLDQHPGYDGLIIFTDGFAPMPTHPKSPSVKVLWLFNNEANWQEFQPNLKNSPMASAFVHAVG